MHTTRNSSVSFVVIVVLFAAFGSGAAAYEVTLTELDSWSYVHLSSEDWNNGDYFESEVIGGSSATATVSHPDGSTYTSTRSVTPTVTRTRLGDWVTTVLSMHILGSFTGVSDNENIFPAEFIGSGHLWEEGWEGIRNIANAVYSLRITGESSTPFVSDNGSLAMTDSAVGWTAPSPYSPERSFEVYQQGNDSLWYPKFSWSDGWPYLSGASTFEMGREYRILALVNGAEYASGVNGNFSHSTDTTISITFSEYVPVFVPEPATWALLLTGGLLTVAYRRRRRR